MALGISQAAALLKEYYDKAAVESLLYSGNPFFGLVNKKTVGGSHWTLPIISGPNSGRSADFTTAQAGAAASYTRTSAFQIVNQPDYSLAVISGQAWYQTMHDADAFLEAATVEIDSAISRLTNSISQKLFRSGFGELGRISTSTSVSGTTIQLADVADIVNFELGDKLMVASTLGASALRAVGSSTNPLIVTAIDRDLGVLTFGYAINDATNGIPTIAQSDYVFFYKDRDPSATPARLVMTGLSGWCPSVAPISGDSFFGVDRSPDPTRLAGIRFSGQGAPMDEILPNAFSRHCREGGKPSHLFVAPSKFAVIENAVGAKQQYTENKTGAGVVIGYSAITVNSPAGPVQIVADRNCPDGLGYSVELDKLTLAHAGDSPVLTWSADNNDVLRQSTSDGIESRQVFYGNLACSKPTAIMSISF